MDDFFNKYAYPLLITVVIMLLLLVYVDLGNIKSIIQMPNPIESDVYDDYKKMEEEVDLSDMENIDFSNLASSHASNQLAAEKNETYTKQRIEKSVEEELKALEESFYDESRTERDANKNYYDQQITEENPNQQETLNQNIIEKNIPETKNIEEKPAFTGQSFYEVFMKDRKVVKEYVPLYLCEGSAIVWINITINQDGKIINKTINTSKTGQIDQCFIDAALKGANKTQFNRDYNANVKQEGLLKYTFVPQ